jgi:hypothetical protein
MKFDVSDFQLCIMSICVLLCVATRCYINILETKNLMTNNETTQLRNQA